MIYLLKKTIAIIKYFIKLQWIIDIFSKTNSVYSNIIHKTPYYKYIRVIFRSSIIIGIIVCLVLKYWKMSHMTKLDSEIEDKNDENKKLYEDKLNDDYDPYHDEMTNENSLGNNNLQSEERWDNQNQNLYTNANTNSNTNINYSNKK